MRKTRVSPGFRSRTKNRKFDYIACGKDARPSFIKERCWFNPKRPLRQNCRCIMSTTIHNRPVLSKLGALVEKREISAASKTSRGGLTRMFQSWKARRAAAAELYAMSDRDLNDIGVSRIEIPAILRTVR
jgi:uncharacterized protein YjiS (DUF1127 family)